jgi:hypothetical protein
METPERDRLTILERAQLLHDATLRRHGELLDQHEEARVQHESRMAHLEAMLERQQQLATQMQALTARVLDRQDAEAVELERHEHILEVLTRIASQHDERMAELQRTLIAIKDMLDRGNGH